MQADLVVAGLSELTQEAYLRTIRQLSNYDSGTRPHDLNEQQVKITSCGCGPKNERLREHRGLSSEACGAF